LIFSGERIASLHRADIGERGELMVDHLQRHRLEALLQFLIGPSRAHPDAAFDVS
jgi:hypothetical protein